MVGRSSVSSAVKPAALQTGTDWLPVRLYRPIPDAVCPTILCAQNCPHMAQSLRCVRESSWATGCIEEERLRRLETVFVKEHSIVEDGLGGPVSDHSAPV